MAVVCHSLVGVTGDAIAQTASTSSTGQIAFDRPEEWAIGVTPRLLALGIDGPIHDSGTWRVGWRAHGQIGTVTAAFTCRANVVPFAPGSANTPTG